MWYIVSPVCEQDICVTLKPERLLSRDRKTLPFPLPARDRTGFQGQVVTLCLQELSLAAKSIFPLYQMAPEEPIQQAL